MKIEEAIIIVKQLKKIRTVGFMLLLIVNFAIILSIVSGVVLDNTTTRVGSTITDIDSKTLLFLNIENIECDYEDKNGKTKDFEFTSLTLSQEHKVGDTVTLLRNDNWRIFIPVHLYLEMSLIIYVLFALLILAILAFCTFLINIKSRRNNNAYKR